METVFFCCVLSYYGNSLQKESICFLFLILQCSQVFQKYPYFPGPLCGVELVEQAAVCML